MKRRTRNLSITVPAIVASIAIAAAVLYFSVGFNESLDRFNPLAREHKSYILVDPDARKVENVTAVDAKGVELPYTVNTIVWANGTEFYAIHHKGSYVTSVEPMEPENVPAEALDRLESFLN